MNRLEGDTEKMWYRLERGEEEMWDEEGKKAESENPRVNRFSWVRWRGRFLIGCFCIGISVYTGPSVLQSSAWMTMFYLTVSGLISCWSFMLLTVLQNVA